MTLEELQAKLKELVGEKVTFRRLAANSIIIYFFGEPGDATVVSVFIDPTWRYERHGEIVLGSYDLQIEEADYPSKEDYKAEWSRRCDLVNGLEGAHLIGCHVDLSSSDLTLEFSDEHVVRSFENSAFEGPCWTYRNVPEEIAALASCRGVELRRLTGP